MINLIKECPMKNNQLIIYQTEHGYPPVERDEVYKDIF